LAIPAIITSGMGLYGLGMGIDGGQGFIVTPTFWGIAIGGLLINMNTGFAYMLDAYRPIAMETFVAATTFKNFMFFGFSYFFNSWIANDGPKKMFCHLRKCVSCCALHSIANVYLWKEDSRILRSSRYLEDVIRELEIPAYFSLKLEIEIRCSKSRVNAMVEELKQKLMPHT
jgi:hypothetical protein